MPACRAWRKTWHTCVGGAFRTCCSPLNLLCSSWPSRMGPGPHPRASRGMRPVSGPHRSWLVLARSWRSCRLRLAMTSRRSWSTDPAGRRTRLAAVRGGGPPWSLRGLLPAPARGSYRIEAIRGDRVVACTEVQVGGGPGNRGSGEWDLSTQAFYAAWVEHLFDAPPEQTLSFPSLEPVLRDPKRNFLLTTCARGRTGVCPLSLIVPTCPISCAPTSPGRSVCLSPIAPAAGVVPAARRAADHRKSTVPLSILPPQPPSSGR